MTFADRYRALVESSAQPANGPVADWRLLHLPGNRPPWIDSGLTVAEGDDATWLAAGKVVLSEELGLWGGPCFHLWARLGEHGTIFKGTRDTFTFRAAARGSLHFATYQGEWGTREGALATPLEAYQGVGGGIDVVVIRWRGSASEGLRRLAELSPQDPLVASECRRLASPVATPAGWEYLWFLGAGEIFEARPHDGRTSISVHTHEDVGILQTRANLELTPDTTISWRWLVSKLPAREAENTIPTHDYLSLAVEFDTGLDLTYYWSAALPAGSFFTCPLPTWAPRETHMVVRSGAEGLGVWQSQEQNLYEDYSRALGAPPKRIVGVWLIAVSLFRHGEGIAEFADIEVGTHARRHRVL
ncbi:MAG: DUF3047 domain-containing protein [Candidatus Binatia bacterium]